MGYHGAKDLQRCQAVRFPEELKKSIVEALTALDPTVLTNLTRSMQKRLIEVIANKGGPTSY